MECLANYDIKDFPSCTEVPLWLWKADPIDGESLTSWVARLAGRLQVDIPDLVGGLNLSEIEARADLDVFPPGALISGLALRTGVSEEKIRLMTLAPFLSVIIREQDQERLLRFGSRPRHLPWILPNGWQNPKYALVRNGGTPYCPQCHFEDNQPHLRLLNRLSPMVVCPRHRVPLREDCPTCGSPTLTWALSLSPEPAISGFPFCWICSDGKVRGFARVRQGEQNYDPSAEGDQIPSLLRFQDLFLEAITQKEVRIPQLGRISGLRFLQGLRHALCAFNALAYRDLDPRNAKPSAGQHQIRSGRGNVRRLAFDFHPVSYRLKLTSWLAWLTERPLERWPILFRMSFLPSQLPRNWKHPWEAVEDDGHTVIAYRFEERNHLATKKVKPEFFRDFFRAADQINLTDCEMAHLLGGVSERTVQRWRMHPITYLRQEPLRRMEQMVSIWGGLKLFAGNRGMAKAWLRTPNQSPLFHGQAPLALLLNPDQADGFDILASFFHSNHTEAFKVKHKEFLLPNRLV